MAEVCITPHYDTLILTTPVLHCGPTPLPGNWNLN